MSQRICTRCGKRPALYIRRQRRAAGRAVVIVGADDTHDLCQQCYRSERDRQRSAELARDVSGFVGGSVFTY